MAASSISYSTGPSGVYLEKIFARWGVLEELRVRIVVPPPGVPVGSLVASGTVQLGFQQLSELINLAGIQVLGPLPAGMQLTTIFSGAVACASTQAQAASALLRYLASPEVRDIKPRFGME
jgi:molybdate transport system substrate-binding protein